MAYVLLAIIQILVFPMGSNIVGVYTSDNLNIVYGSYLDDAYLMISDIESGEIYNENIVDEGFKEKFVYLAEVKYNQFILLLEMFDNENNDYYYSLYLYNSYGELLNQVDLTIIPEAFYNYHQVLVLRVNNDFVYIDNDLIIKENIEFPLRSIGEMKIQHQGNAVINGHSTKEILLEEPGIYELEITYSDYVYKETITIEPKIEIKGDVYKEGFINNIRLISKGNIFINNKVYISGEVLSSPGVYNVTIMGVNNYVHTSSLIIYPQLQYFNGIDQFRLEDGIEIDRPIRLYSNSESILINERLYLNNIISNPGKYLVKLLVGDEVIDTLSFSIISSVEGVEDNQTYKTVSIYAFGDVLLNDEKIEGYVTLTKPGTYQIEIMDNKQLVEEIRFYIEGPITSKNTSILPYGILVISLIGFVIILLKK